MRLALASVFLICSIQAQNVSTPAFTANMVNGRGWLSMDESAQVYYLAGLRDSVKFISIMGAHGSVESANSAVDKNWNQNFSVDDYRRELGVLYAETENVRLPVTLAVSYCTDKLSGGFTKQALEKKLITMRTAMNELP